MLGYLTQTMIRRWYSLSAVLKMFFPYPWCCWKVVKPWSCGIWWEEGRSPEPALELCGKFCPFIFLFPGCHTMTCFLYYWFIMCMDHYVHNHIVLPQHRPKSNEWTDHVLKSPKVWIKVFLLLFLFLPTSSHPPLFLKQGLCTQSPLELQRVAYFCPSRISGICTTPRYPLLCEGWLPQVFCYSNRKLTNMEASLPVSLIYIFNNCSLPSVLSHLLGSLIDKPIFIYTWCLFQWIDLSEFNCTWL